MDAIDGSFGVPRKVPLADLPFLVSAGIGLTVVTLAIIGALVRDLGLSDEPDSAPVAVIALAGLFAGTPAAYYVGRWLRARNLSRLLGCAGLVVWTFLLAASALVAGWIGVALAIVIPAGLMWRKSASRPAQPAPALGRSPLPGSGYPGDSAPRWRPALPVLRRRPAEPASPVRRSGRWIPVAGNVLWIGAVVAWYLLSGGGGEREVATEPIADRAGTITFGTGINVGDGTITGEASVFHPGDSIAWSVALAETTEATELELRVSQVANNDKAVETVPIPIDEGGADTIWVERKMPVTQDMIGFWMLEVLDGEDVLATGTFTVKAR